MSKSKRARKYDKLHARIDAMVTRQKTKDEAFQASMPPDYKQVRDEFAKRQYDRFRSMLTPEVLESMSRSVKILESLDEAARLSTAAMVRFNDRYFKSEHGYLPGSRRTKRLTKKRETMMKIPRALGRTKGEIDNG